MSGMRVMRRVLCILAAGFLWQGQAWCQPLLVNIDNPNFRKLSAAVPVFFVSTDKSSPEAKEFAQVGPEELRRLFDFSGLFNNVGEAAYKDLLSGMQESFNKMDAEKLISGPVLASLHGVDVAQWKALGVESLTVGRTMQEKDGLALEIRTIDITRSEVLLAKRYTKIQKADYIRLMRRYANLVLEAYTGKPGIFSSKIVFIGRRTKASAKQVYICDFDGSNVVQLTNHNSPHVSPHFSPDGRFITFTSYRDKNPDLYIYELATGKVKKLSGQQGLNSGAQWAPNGKLIAYSASHAGDTDIMLIKPDGTGRRPFIKGTGLDVDPTFSPDGRYIAFVSGRFGNPHIFLGTLEWQGEENVRVVADKRLTYAGWYNAVPDWSPESDKIAFAGYDKDIERFDLFVMNPDGSQLERLTLKRGDNESPSWAPNGQLLVFQSNRMGDRDVKGVAQLYIMSRDGSGQRMLNTGLYEAQTPEWSGSLYQ